MTPDATRRRAIGQILLLAAGLVVLTIISAGSVHLVNLAREDARSVVHTVESTLRPTLSIMGAYTDEVP